MDPFAQFKQVQKTFWPHFAAFEPLTTPAAACLVHHARVQAGQRVLDVACGTGVVAVTAARRGAAVTGVDLTPELLSRARDNADIAGVAIDFQEGDVEALPFGDAAFDVVVSQFGHMFAPRPDRAIGEMLRVLKPGGTIAFSTWPPEVFTGRMFALTARYLPPPDPAPAPPTAWGEPAIIRERLGDGARDLRFDRRCLLVPALSPAHHRAGAERAAGSVIRLVEMLGDDPATLEAFRCEYDALAAEYFHDNVLRQDYLLTGAIKR
jgi:SAM-dependent methyltransferase